MATGGADKVVKLWDPATGANTGSLRVCFCFLVDTTHAAFALFIFLQLCSGLFAVCIPTVS